MMNSGWDLQVEWIDLDGLGIDAGQELGMVLVQPEYELVADGEVPFRIANACREAQKGLIERAFQIRAAESQERRVPIPFILFPEAAIPVGDPDGLDCLLQQMEQVQGDMVFIGGLEGLSPGGAQELADRFPPAEGAVELAFAGGAFVNVCVIVVKAATGPPSWHFQAKVRPSQWEQQRNMARGRRVLYFVAPQVAFLCQICFDHIAAQGEEPLNTALCQQLIERAQPIAATLDFVFVPQFNPKPDDPSVRQNTGRLLKHQHRALMNEMTAVVFVNKAASVQEPSEYGRSGFHYRAGRWQVPTSDVGPKGYELCDFDGVTSAVFRRRTHAIHVATLVPASHNIGSPGNPRRPLENPRSYLIGGGCDPDPCSCLPGTQRTVGTFVECDCLPCKLRDTLLADLPTKDDKRRWQGSDVGQPKLLEQHYGEIRKDLLMLRCARAREVVCLLLHMHDPKEDNCNNPDLWSALQFEAVVEFLAALSVLAELQPVNFDTVLQWTAWLGESLAVVLLDGAEKRHSWDEMVQGYAKTFEGQYYHPDARQKPVLFVALRSIGLVQPLVKPTSPDFTKPTDPNRLGDHDSFAKPTPLRFYVCQDALFEGARQDESMTEFLKREMRCLLE